jgi:dolichyl-phosphate beta-glucosyltransferase
MISVVCPFYNEETILEASTRRMLGNLASLAEPWELILVDDGSQDSSLEIARRLEREDPRLRVVTYPYNRGRGYALRAGVGEARGEIVVTTEIDSSWGDDIVHRLVAKLKARPDVDIVIASPHLPGGGYVNVPLSRVFLSTFGNYIIRTGLTYNVTMNTGMTRAYRREKFLALPLDENDKEMHLEIINKALAFGYRISEVPAVLEWKDARLAARPGKRKSSARVGRLIRTHLLFSLVAAPFRYLFLTSGVLAALAALLLGWGLVNLLTPAPSVYLLLISSTLGSLALLVLGFGVLAHQGRFVQRELWRIRQELREVKQELAQERERTPGEMHQPR